jgi:hypothetical protein
VVAETVGCREDVGWVVFRWGEIELKKLRTQIVRSPKFRTFPSKVTQGFTGLHPTHPSNPRVGTPASPKAVTCPKGLVDTQHLAVSDAHPVVSAQNKLST